MSKACDWLIFYGAQLSHIVSINNAYKCSHCDTLSIYEHRMGMVGEKAFHQKDLINFYTMNPIKKHLLLALYVS